MCVHVEAGEWGAGVALSDVDMVISMCIRSRTLVYSLACNRRLDGSGDEEGGEPDVSYCLPVLSFLSCGSGA